MDAGYFPLLILLFDGKGIIDYGREVVVNSPQEIPSGVTFKVLETNYETPLVVKG